MEKQKKTHNISKTRTHPLPHPHTDLSRVHNISINIFLTQHDQKSDCHRSHVTHITLIATASP